MTSFILQSVNTPGDGNCFYYSFLQCLLEKQISKEEVLQFKSNLASSLSPMSLLPFLKEEVQLIISKQVENHPELKKLVETDFDEAIQHHDINQLLVRILNHFKMQLEADGIWPEDWAQQYCAKYHKVNILVYIDSCKLFSPIFSIVEDWPVIILYNKSNLHWESGILIVKRENEPDKIYWKYSYNVVKNLIT